MGQPLGLTSGKHRCLPRVVCKATGFEYASYLHGCTQVTWGNAAQTISGCGVALEQRRDKMSLPALACNQGMCAHL